MSLTRIRAEQIYNSDYKQAARVVTSENIASLNGGAPRIVDGITLAKNNRVLVNGQDNAVENGIYYVDNVGSGSNGVWVRTSDANQNGEIMPGMVIMVTEGNIYADTSWKLVTNTTIVIGVSPMNFQINTGSTFGNIVANGTSVTSNSAIGVLNFAAGNNITITGNNTTKTITFSATGGGGGSGTAIVNGDSNVDIASANANITMSVAGVSNVAVVNTTGISVTGNVSANYFIGNGSQLTGLPASYGNSNVTTLLSDGSVTSNITTSGNVSGGNVISSGIVSAVGNITTSGNVSGGNVISSGIVSAVGNITGDYILGNGSLLTGIITSVSNISSGNSNVNVVSSGGNVTVGINGSSNIAVISLAGLDVIGHIQATANVTGQNLVTAGNVSGNYILGNGSQLTGITGGSSATNGIFVNTSNVSANYTIAAGTNGMSVGPITVNNGVVATVDNGQRWVIL